MYPRSQLDVEVHVSQSDESLLCAAINACSLALNSAAVYMRDVVAACWAGWVDQCVRVSGPDCGTLSPLPYSQQDN